MNRTIQGWNVGLFIIALGIFWGAFNEASAANEQRCNELGVNCICSEPLNTPTWLPSPDNNNWNPADTTGSDKQCNFEGSAGAVLNHSGLTMTPLTSGPMFTALPAKSPAITYLQRGPIGASTGFIGHTFPPSTPTTRRAYRVYLYYSSDFQLETDACTNHSKIFQFGHLPNLSALLSRGGGNYELYGWTGWNSNPDCCVQGPGNSAYFGTYTTARVAGRWWRYELIITNTTAGGTPTAIKIYQKNVTDNTPEILLIDTTVVTPQPVGDNWDYTRSTTLSPAATNLDQMWIDSFTNGTCAGYHGFTHLLAAAWNTDSGQRIGAAVEIEGGGAGLPPSAPAAPTNLTVTKLMKNAQ